MLTYLTNFYNLLKRYTTPPKFITPTPEKRSHTRWTPLEVGDLVLMYKNQMSLKDLAYELDRSIQSVRSKLNRLGYSANPKISTAARITTYKKYSNTLGSKDD